MILKRSSHIPISMNVDTTKSMTGLLRARPEKRASGTSELHTYSVITSGANVPVARQKSELRSKMSPLYHAETGHQQELGERVLLALGDVGLEAEVAPHWQDQDRHHREPGEDQSTGTLAGVMAAEELLAAVVLGRAHATIAWTRYYLIYKI